MLFRSLSSTHVIRQWYFMLVTAIVLSIGVLPDTASAAASFVRASTNKATGSAGTYTMTVTLTGTPSAGNLLIAALSLKNQPAATPTMSGWNTRDTIVPQAILRARMSSPNSPSAMSRVCQFPSIAQE